MGLLTMKRKFSVPGDDAKWLASATEKIKLETVHFTVTRNGETLIDEMRPASVTAISEQEHFELANGLSLEIGYVSLTKLGVVVRDGETILTREPDKPFRKPGKLDTALAKLEALEDAEPTEPTPEQKAIAERQKALRPSIAVDIAFGVLFFFVAREFGLVTAALTGAAATIVLTIVDQFVKMDLLGGFAVFGVVMSLISAGIAWGFQDDLAIKLRGTWMAIIGAFFSLFDAIVLKGSYLGKRMAMYMEGLYRLNPQRASFALAGATLILMMIDTPLAFILTTDQWIWYNSFFDNFIGIPIVLGSLYFAREKTPA
jgi:intracellular septation protein A